MREGHDLTLDVRVGDGRGLAWGREQATDLVAREARVIVALGAFWNSTREVTNKVPIVMLGGGGDILLSLGWASSLAKPGGNITGLAFLGPEITSKRIQILLETAPSVRRLVLMSNLGQSPLAESYVRDGTERLGMDLLVLDVRAPVEVEPAFERARAWGASGLIAESLNPASLLSVPVIKLASRHRLPATYNHRLYMDAGGLMSYGVGWAEGYAPRRGAWYVARILGGTPPGDLPIEGPNESTLSVNRTTLAGLGLTLPSHVAVQVTQWID